LNRLLEKKAVAANSFTPPSHTGIELVVVKHYTYTPIFDSNV
jgi:hypothetical protein